MTKLWIALSIVAAFRGLDAKRVNIVQEQYVETSTNHSDDLDAPKKGVKKPAQPEKPTCDQIYDALMRIPMDVENCKPSAGGNPFCCDSWMNHFGRQLKAYNNVDPILQQVKLKMMLWKWLIRPQGNTKKNAHNAAMHFDHQYLNTGNHDEAQWQHVGKDSHYFTIVKYCPKRYAIFDTVKPMGRDVSADFENNEIVSYDRIAGPFKFAYSETIDGPAQECTFEECVAKGCQSDWIDPKLLNAHKAVSKKGRKCFLGISF